MDAKALILLDLKECRRRFLIVARGFSDDLLCWKPDARALTVGETIRHVLLHDFSWLTILREHRLPSEEERKQIWGKPFVTIESEIAGSNIYHDSLLSYVNGLPSSTYSSKMIKWPHKDIERSLGDTLERKSYHDAVHTGQLLQYMRMLQIERPDIWD
ncbi:DinB family protein [Cytobacillus sp. Hm23]